MKDKLLRNQLVLLLRGGESHIQLEDAIRGFPSSFAESGVELFPHTPWRLLEHMRIAQWDILEFCRNPDHVSPEFPDGYWPSDDSPSDTDSWTKSVSTFCSDLAAMQNLLMDPASDIHAPIPQGTGQTLLREALVLADHNSYHLGQLMAIRRGLEKKFQRTN